MAWLLPQAPEIKVSSFFSSEKKTLKTQMRPESKHNRIADIRLRIGPHDILNIRLKGNASHHMDGVICLEHHFM